MYSKIVNPRTGRRVSVKSRLGKNILINYLFILSGGAAPRVWIPKYKIKQTAHRGPDDPVDRTIVNTGSGSLSLREVVNWKVVMKNIFQYAKQSLDLTMCADTLTGHSGDVWGALR